MSLLFSRALSRTRTLALLALAFTLFFSSSVALAGIEEDSEHLKTIPGPRFNDAISHDMTFVEFFSPWCGHCRNFAPTWKSLAEIQEHRESEGFKLRRVNCERDGDTCDAQGVTGYPTLQLYRNGKLVEKYKGDRSFEDLMTYTTAKASDYRREKAKGARAARQSQDRA